MNSKSSTMLFILRTWRYVGELKYKIKVKCTLIINSWFSIFHFPKSPFIVWKKWNKKWIESPFMINYLLFYERKDEMIPFHLTALKQIHTRRQFFLLNLFLQWDVGCLFSTSNAASVIYIKIQWNTLYNYVSDNPRRLDTIPSLF